MKKTFSPYSLFLLVILTFGIVSCSDETNETIPGQPLNRSGIPVSLSLTKAAQTQPELNFGLYIFSRPNTEAEGYQLDTCLQSIGQDTRLTFSNRDLSERNYRFLFTATADEHSIRVSANGSSTGATKGTPWNDLRITYQSDSLSPANYYAVKDYTGHELASTDSVSATLGRIVGQMIYSFSKVGTDIDDVQEVDLEHVASVFDRIYRIDILYSGYTTALSFNGEGKLQPSETATTATKTQTFRLSLDARLKAGIPQKTAGVDTLDGGAARGGKLWGLYLLPASQTVLTQLTFYYYDTTPTCGKTEGHIHSAGCYTPETLELTIPFSGAFPGLTIEANTYTHNKAGIRCDRIIDINSANGMILETDWNTKWTTTDHTN